VTVGVVPIGTLIVNGDYGARSDQVTHTVGGPPVWTMVSEFRYVYLPVLLR
jgi:hypothetical protein